MARTSRGVEIMGLPTKFYVTRILRSNEEVLGFMVVADAEHTKGFQKKKESADKWARGSKLEPIYTDNIPKTGFQMVTNVSRYSTSNVVWRVRHPDGFEFEITSDNFMDLIETSTIEEGLIKEELFFTENRKLVSTKTKLFADMIKKEEKKEQQADLLSEFKEGDLFELEDSTITKDQYRYCGKYHMIVMNKNRELCIPEKSSKKEVIQNMTSGAYHIRSKISDFPIKKVGSVDVDRNLVQLELNDVLRQPFKSVSRSYDILADYYELFVCGNDKPFKLSDCTVDYVDIDPKTIRKDINRYFMYIEHNGKIMRVLGAYKIQRGYYSGDKEPTGNWWEAKGLFTYDAELQENGQLVMHGVDLNQHQSFGTWRNKTPFTGLSSYSSSDKTAKLYLTQDMPETIKFGTVKIGK